MPQLQSDITAEVWGQQDGGTRKAETEQQNSPSDADVVSLQIPTDADQQSWFISLV